MIPNSMPIPSETDLVRELHDNLMMQFDRFVWCSATMIRSLPHVQMSYPCEGEFILARLASVFLFRFKFDREECARLGNQYAAKIIMGEGVDGEWELKREFELLPNGYLCVSGELDAPVQVDDGVIFQMMNGYPLRAS